MTTFTQPTLEQAITAGKQGQADADRHADEQWKAAAYRQIRWMQAGREFLAEEIVFWTTHHGYSTHTNKAVGPVIARAAREGLIVKTGRTAPAKTSHGSPKPVWRKVTFGISGYEPCTLCGCILEAHDDTHDCPEWTP